MATTFQKIHTANRGVSTYKADGFPGVILLAKPAFNGVHPASIEVNDVPEPIAGARASRPAMTKDERKAAAKAERDRIKGLTPAQRAQEKIDKAEAALAAARALAASVPAGVEASA